MATIQEIKALRDATGAGMGACKEALEASGGDPEKAKLWLRQRGHQSVADRMGRVAKEGLVGSYVHNGKIAVIIEVNCETDFAAKNELFGKLVKRLAMQVAAMNPLYITRNEISPAVITSEITQIQIQLTEAGKKYEMFEKIVPGKMEKFYQERCLVDQVLFDDPTGKMKVGDMLAEAGVAIGEKISIRRFTRYLLGDGI